MINSKKHIQKYIYIIEKLIQQVVLIAIKKTKIYRHNLFLCYIKVLILKKFDIYKKKLRFLSLNILVRML